MRKPLPPRFTSAAGAAVLALTLLAQPVAAQPVAAQPVAPGIGPAAPAPVPAPGLLGRTLDGRAFALSDQRQKVVLVYYWRTDCAVCRSVMAELRANYDGWQGKPFELVAVNLDARRADLVDYERIIATTVPTRQRFPALWAGEPGHVDRLLPTAATLPHSVILDAEGKVVSRHQGRMPAEAWDRIAELLP